MQATEDYEHAERNQRTIITSFPSRLAAREDRFLQQLQRAKVSPLKQLEMLYVLMDDLAKAVHPYTPCRKGCNACCHYQVSVSEIEIRYIEKHTKHRRKKNHPVSYEFDGSPCPFLKNGECTVYSVRPFVCRRHHALTPTAYWCAPDRSTQHKFPMVRFTGVEGALDHIVQESKVRRLCDIREVFDSGR